jgi:hypothetical protein
LHSHSRTFLMDFIGLAISCAESGIYINRLCPWEIYTYYSAFKSFHSPSCIFLMCVILAIGCGESGLYMSWLCPWEIYIYTILHLNHFIPTPVYCSWGIMV